MRFFACFALIVCLATSGFAADAIFSPATTPATTAAATVPATTATIQASTPAAPAATNWLNTLLSLMTSPAALGVIAGIVIRLEAYLQAKSKINLQEATGVAHSVFNQLYDMGLIKNGNFRTAEELFFQLQAAAYQNAYGHLPDPTAENASHSLFVELFTNNTDMTPPPTPAAAVASTAVSLNPALASAMAVTK